MLRVSLPLRAVREFGHVFFRTPIKTIQQRAAQTPLLQERPYPLGEIVRRIVRLRVRYQDCEDEQERALLRGEYKFYTGKGVQLRDAQTADLVAAVSCAAFFGFCDSALLDRVMALLLARGDELTPLELCQLAQDLPRVGKPRGAHMRSVFRLLCGNHLAALRALELEDHLDLLENAVGTHCPFVFVDAVLFTAVAPHVLTSAAGSLPALGCYVAVLDALVVREQVMPARMRHGGDGDGSGGASDPNAKQKAQLVRAVRQHLLEACRDESPRLTPDMVAQTFEQLSALGALDVFSARTLRQWFDAHKVRQLTEPVAAIAMCVRQAQLFGVVATSSATGGAAEASGSDFTRMFSLFSATIIEDSIPALDIADLPVLFDLLALIVSQHRHSNAATVAMDPALRVVFDAVVDAALTQLGLLRSAGGTVWPAATLMRLLSAMVHIAKFYDDGTDAPVPEGKRSQEAQQQRPGLLQSAVKSLCAGIVAVAPSSLSARDCVAFLIVATEMPGSLMLDASISAVARCLLAATEAWRTESGAAEASADVDDGVTFNARHAADLLVVLRTAPPSVRKNAVVAESLIPALLEMKDV